MKYYYSPSTKGFYIKQLGGFPPDIVEITEEKHKELLTSQSTGKIIDSDNDGNPISKDHPLPSVNTLAKLIRQQRKIKAVCALDAREKYKREQESISKGITIDSPMSEAEYIEVLKYLKGLFDLPQKEGFPWNGPDDIDCPWPIKPDCVEDNPL